MFQTEDVADFFVSQHMEVREQPLPFVRKAKRILKVVVKEMSSDLPMSELYDYIEHASSVRNSDRQYNGLTFYDSAKQIFVTYLKRHIPRSLKIGNRWCLVFDGGYPAPPRRPPRVSTIAETPASEEPPSQMELEAPGQGASVVEISDTNSEQSENSGKIFIDEPMPEVSLTSKRVRKPEERSKGEEKIVKKKEKKNDKEDTTEFDSCMEHLRVIVEELESSNILGMEPSVDVERAIGTMIAMAGSTRSEGDIPSNCWKFYKQRKQIINNNVCLKDFHEEIKREDFYSKFLSKVLLFGSPSEQQPP